MKCTSCGVELPATAKFCPNCGFKVNKEIFCPECGQQVSSTSKFCHNCGSRIAEGDTQKQTQSTSTTTAEPQIDVELLCPHCYSRYSVSKEDWNKENIYWDCPNCNGRIEAAFCGYCDQHNGYIAFRPYNNKEMLGATIAGGISGYNNPEETIVNFIGNIFDSTPKARAQGVCPRCQAEFMKCPACNRAVHITYDDGGVVICPDCKTKFKMN